MDLHETVKIGKKTMKNRLAVAPMGLIGEDHEGYVAPVKIDHYGALARGGAGMIICEASVVGDSLHWHRKPMRAFDEKILPGYRSLVSVIREAGALAVMQLYYPMDWPFEIPPAEAFAKSAAICEQAGFDGVELHAAHGYLLSKATCLEGPGLLRETFEAVRAAVSADFIVGIRLGATDPDLQALVKTAKCLEDADYLSISYGREAGPMGTAPYLEDSWFHAAAKVKEVVSIPVFGVGQVRKKEDAEKMLALSACDVVCVGRAALADYNFCHAILNDEPFFRCYNCRQCAWNQDRRLCPARTKAKRTAEKQHKMGD